MNMNGIATFHGLLAPLPAAGKTNEPTLLPRTPLLGHEQGLHSTERGKSHRGDKSAKIIKKQATGASELLTCEKNQC